MRKSLLGVGLAAAAMGMGMASSQAAPAQQPVQKQAARSESPRVEQKRKRRTLRSYFEAPMLYASHMTSARTVAQDKRRARKRKNKGR
ncbi:hypothetical protein y223_00039 [Bordetella phage PY223]